MWLLLIHATLEIIHEGHLWVKVVYSLLGQRNWGAKAPKCLPKSILAPTGPLKFAGSISNEWPLQKFVPSTGPALVS